jgi:UDP-perosamine 4-acetyltransferase
MDKEKVVVIGAGGHCRAVLDILLDDERYEAAGLVDTVDFDSYQGVPVIGDDRILPSVIAKGIHKAFIAIGDNHIRGKIYDEMKAMGFTFMNVISPNAYISPRTVLGSGIVVMHGAIIHTGCKIGDGVIVNTNASIDHDCSIGDFSHVAPSAALCGQVTVGNRAFIGAGAHVIENIRIGNQCVIGAGSVVIRNLGEGVKAVGIPAKPIHSEEN